MDTHGTYISQINDSFLDTNYLLCDSLHVMLEIEGYNVVEALFPSSGMETEGEDIKPERYNTESYKHTFACRDRLLVLPIAIRQIHPYYQPLSIYILVFEITSSKIMLLLLKIRFSSIIHR